MFIMENGGRRITGTYISLDSVVHAYWNGQSIDEIVADFSSLYAAQVKDISTVHPFRAQGLLLVE